LRLLGLSPTRARRVLQLNVWVLASTATKDYCFFFAPELGVL
jgi:hypothetical protein